MKPIDAAEYMKALEKMHAVDHGKGWRVDDVADYATTLLAYEHRLLAVFCSPVVVVEPESERTLRLFVNVPGHETLTIETRLPPLGDNLTLDWITRYLRDWLFRAESGVVDALSPKSTPQISDHFFASEPPPSS